MLPVLSFVLTFGTILLIAISNLVVGSLTPIKTLTVSTEKLDSLEPKHGPECTILNGLHCEVSDAERLPLKANGPKVTDKVTLFIELDGEGIGEIVIGLFGGTVPKTVRNFIELCNRPEGQGYKGTKFHKIIHGLYLQAGDYVNDDGTGSDSIYGQYFDDENFKIRHVGNGWVSMGSVGPNKNGCQFRINLKPLPHLDGRKVVFGKVLEGMEIVRQIEDSRWHVDMTFAPSVIYDCQHEVVDEPFRVPNAASQEVKLRINF